jgi:hypothetical protein
VRRAGALVFVVASLLSAWQAGVAAAGSGSDSAPPISVVGIHGSFRWKVSIEPSRTGGVRGACLSAGLTRADGTEPVGTSKLCGDYGGDPLVVSSSVGSGRHAGEVIGVMTPPGVAEVIVSIRGRKARHVPLRVLGQSRARRLGLAPLGYAAIPFNGPGCLHRLIDVAPDGEQIGRAVNGC